MFCCLCLSLKFKANFLSSIFSIDDVEFIAKTASKQNWLGQLFLAISVGILILLNVLPISINL